MKMMKRVVIGVLAAALVLVGLSMIPVDAVDSSYTSMCYHSQEWKEQRKVRLAQERKRRQLSDESGCEIHIAVFGTPKPTKSDENGCLVPIDQMTQAQEVEKQAESEMLYEISVRKSGIRRAIEGRMNWLGVNNSLDFLDKDACPENG